MPKELLARPIHQARSFYERHERYWPAIFFVGGFLFDILTLDRIDSWITIGQQGTYLVILSLIYGHWLIQTQRQWDFSPRWKWYETWRGHIGHFLFGSLLSSFTLFYFVSASISTSFIFLALIAALLLLNEIPRFQSFGLTIKFGLLSLCWASYFAYVLPTVVGAMGTGIFVFSLFLAFLPLALIARLAQRHLVTTPAIAAHIWRPSGIVAIVFLFSYLFRIIPPVPLSIQYIGVYHSVTKTPEGQYQLAHLRPWWRFWHNGDQIFMAQPGDKLVVFFRLFSPTKFSDRVRIIWYQKDGKGNWIKQDSIPIEIVGGRAEGFRGYGLKGNYLPGRWRALVETSDGREIGRISFWVGQEDQAPREFKFDYQ